jgi:hypothetical protein
MFYQHFRSAILMVKLPNDQTAAAAGPRRQGRRSFSTKEAKAIRERIREVMNECFGSKKGTPKKGAHAPRGPQTPFANALAIPRITVAGWFAKEPACPDAHSLALIARRFGISINWLLLGEGPRSLHAVGEGGDLAQQLRKHVLDVARSSGWGPTAERYGSSGEAIIATYLGQLRRTIETLTELTGWSPPLETIVDERQILDACVSGEITWFRELGRRVADGLERAALQAEPRFPKVNIESSTPSGESRPDGH